MGKYVCKIFLGATPTCTHFHAKCLSVINIFTISLKYLKFLSI